MLRDGFNEIFSIQLLHIGDDKVTTDKTGLLNYQSILHKHFLEGFIFIYTELLIVGVRR